jgi:hypothetical protein
MENNEKLNVKNVVQKMVCFEKYFQSQEELMKIPKLKSLESQTSTIYSTKSILHHHVNQLMSKDNLLMKKYTLKTFLKP